MDYGPYKGPAQSYQVEDTDFFFGRDVESQRLLARILSSNVTLLHARSGAGKTSLLNARVVPGLERRGWTVVRTTFFDEPIEAVRDQLVLSLVPPPAAEAAAIARACRSLGVAREQTLDDLLAAYDTLPAHSSLARHLVAVTELAGVEGAPERFRRGAVMPVFSRLLRSTLDTDTLRHHLIRVAGDEGALGGEEDLGAIEVGRLVAAIRGLEGGYRRLMARIEPPAGDAATGRDLGALIDRIFEHYDAPDLPLRLVIVLDQFEEIFTKFQDPGAVARRRAKKTLLDWRLRREFFEQLESMYQRCRRHQTAAGPCEALPLRFVIGIREDYLGQLDVVRRFVPDLDENSYRLNLLVLEQALEALQKPARLYGFEYADACAERILGELKQEDTFVEPGLLQMVCSRMWLARGHELARAPAAAPTAGNGYPQIEPAVFDDAVEGIGGVEGVVDAFVNEALAGLDDNDRREALDVLQALITSDRTRDSVGEDQIVQAPYRFSRQRKHLLAHLERQGLVRVESRLNDRFVEISHEILIDSILRVFREEATASSETLRFRRGALAALTRASKEPDILRAAELISKREFRAALDYKNLINFSWVNPELRRRRGAELMYRNALKYLDGDGDDAAVLKLWGESMEDDADAGKTLIAHEWALDPRPLSRSQWRFLACDTGAPNLTPGQLETMYRSALCHPREGDDDSLIVYWARRYEQL